MALEQITSAWCKYIYNHWPGGYSVTGDGEPPYLSWTQGNSWQAGITWPRWMAVTYGGSVYYSLQANNVGHQPDTSPEWWALSGGWRELDHIMVAIPGYLKSTTPIGSVHIDNPSLTTWAWQYVNKPAGPCQWVNGGDPNGQPTLRQSPTSATCYAFHGAADGYGSIDFSVFRIRNGVETLIGTPHMAESQTTYRFLCYGENPTHLKLQTDPTGAGYSPGSEVWTGPTGPLSPSNGVWVNGWEFTDTDPITSADGPYTGFRQGPSTGESYTSIHEYQCGSFGTLIGERLTAAGSPSIIGGSRVPGTEITVT